MALYNPKTMGDPLRPAKIKKEKLAPRDAMTATEVQSRPTPKLPNPLLDAVVEMALSATYKYRDPEKRRAQVREAVARHRAAA